MNTYSVGDVSTALNLSQTTIRNYTSNKNCRKYLSSMARREDEHKDAKQRIYTQDDLYVLNTMRTQKHDGNTWADIASMLEDGFRDEELPESAALVMPETRADAFSVISQARAKIEFLQNRIDELQDEIERLRNENKDLNDKRVSDVMGASQEMSQRIGELTMLLKLNDINPETGRKTDE